MSVGRNILNHTQKNVSQSPLEMWFGLKTDDDQLVKETVIAELRRGETRLYDATPALQADKEVVLAAVAENGMALRGASKALKDDKEVVLVAVAQNGRSLKYASKSLQRDKKFEFECFCWHLQS